MTVTARPLLIRDLRHAATAILRAFVPPTPIRKSIRDSFTPYALRLPLIGHHCRRIVTAIVRLRVALTTRAGLADIATPGIPPRQHLRIERCRAQHAQERAETPFGQRCSLAAAHALVMS